MSNQTTRGNFANDSNDELEQRKNALDSLLQNAALAGVEVPEEQQREFVEIQEELARRRSDRT